VQSDGLARLPKVDRVLQCGTLSELGVRPQLKKRAVNRALQRLRELLLAGEPADVPDAESLATQVRGTLDAWLTPRPRSVINGTGVVLHTNVGRAPLSASAIAAMGEAARASDLEIDLSSGERGSRFVHLRPFMAAVLSSEDVHVVNNGAAALLLACSALGGRGGVAISRGQMVEIGDGFRVAEMAAAGGTTLCEVGSTNRTHADDYEKALRGELPGQGGQGVSALLWVHLSNFDQSGFTRQVDLRALSKLSKQYEVPLVADLGSGSLGAGLPEREPTVSAYLDDGADLVTFSGDKLLGGPQAGIMAGSAEIVRQCARHPMSRALRPDKTTLAALHATLAAHAVDGIPDLPVHHMVGATKDELWVRARNICGALSWGEDRVRETVATIGGGSLPGDTLDSVGLFITGEHPNRAARALRLGTPAVIGRVQSDELVIDLRTVDPVDDEALVAALRAFGA
jgi:L-seryl-tRNA(Ser) seleniumtransferase